MLSAIVVGASGGRYAFVMGPPVRPPWSGTPLLALGLTAVVVSFWLARNVTAPVRRLRAATLRLAGGELQARVGGRLGRRRDVLGDLARDFDIMAERLESLVGAQRRLLRDVSHELRSPLARLHVALGLAGRCATPDAAEALARIEYEAHVINALIDDLLVLVRLEAGDPGRGDELVDLVDVVQQVADDANFEAGARNRSVRVLGEDTCNVRGTRSLLHRAIENVVRNAIRYTADGTTVDISLATEAAADGAWARVSVRDRGPGVPEETLPELFRAFYRVGNARDRQSGGVGLGLAIAERATRLHGGDIRAANAEDGGLLVEFRLPM
jgi:two-component system sensor histidine kinase CpxA